MKCPFCAHDDTQVKDSRPSEDGTTIRRRRACPECSSRFTTFERVQVRELTVIKRDGERKPFDRDKIARAIGIACRKRPVSPEQIEQLVTTVTHRLESSGEGEVTAEQIGEMIMDELKRLDKVAYIRFASVYRNFSEARDFEELAGSLKPKAKAS